MEKKCLGVPAKRFALYCVLSLVGLASSVLSVWLGVKWRDSSVINYFLSFSASLIITAIFAYLIDLINQKEKAEIDKTKRAIYLNPVVTNIASLIIRVVSLYKNKNQLEDADFSLDTFEKCYKAVFSDYCECLRLLTGPDKNLETINEAFNIKNGVQKYSVEEIANSIDLIINNETMIKFEGLLSDSELFLLKNLKEAMEGLYLPYLDTLSYDRNTARAPADWPKEPVNDIVKNNYNGSISRFVFEIKCLTENFNEFKPLLNIMSKASNPIVNGDKNIMDSGKAHS